jgi:geranylgeranyl pyrophosphate synthase
VAFLYLRAYGIELTQAQYDVQTAIELIHNATLIHDDVIDNSDTRRGQKTLNSEFDNSLAVISGDFLLSAAMKKLLNLNSCEILSIFARAIEKMCLGEINQYFNRFKTTSIDEYIEKSRNKTATLFMTSLESASKLNEKMDVKKALDFAENFGIAFQIRDDLLNFTEKNDKPTQNDFASGIYTAPVIFSEDIRIGVEKTKQLLDNYVIKSVKSLETADKNIYTEALINLTELLKI